jgi:hypothetical protein
MLVVKIVVVLARLMGSERWLVASHDEMSLYVDSAAAVGGDSVVA